MITHKTAKAQSSGFCYSPRQTKSESLMPIRVKADDHGSLRAGPILPSPPAVLPPWSRLDESKCILLESRPINLRRASLRVDFEPIVDRVRSGCGYGWKAISKGRLAVDAFALPRALK